MDIKIESSWKEKLSDEFHKQYFQELRKFIRREYLEKTIYPPPKYVFYAFEKCAFDDVKVVILGQDPYHGPNQAHGLAFSVSDQVAVPPSLANIYKELKNDLGREIPATGNLEKWASQGVLLLNATLTVTAHQPGSHQKKGWEIFTDVVIQKLSQERRHLVFILWGAYAQKKGRIIDEKKHLVIKSPHPSPLSAYNGFFGSKPFSRTNKYLQDQGKRPIDW